MENNSDSDYDDTVETIKINQDFIHFANNLKDKYNLEKEKIFNLIVNDILDLIKKNENT